MKDKLNVIKALAAFQSECPPFIKNTEGYGYKYSTLPEIWSTITPLLRKQGLMVTQFNNVNDETIGVTTILTHIETGESLTSTFTTTLVELKGMNLYQSAGSAITYARRYDLSTLLGLQSEKDDDGGSGKPTSKVYKKQQSKAVPKQSTKPTLPESGEKFDKAVEYLKSGNTIDDLKKYYSVSKAVEEKLTK
jgi:hypothetical protein